MTSCFASTRNLNLRVCTRSVSIPRVRWGHVFDEVGDSVGLLPLVPPVQPALFVRNHNIQLNIWLITLITR